MSFKPLLLLLSLLIALPAFATDPLRVGVKVSEPFVIETASGLSGDAVNVWESTYTGASRYTTYSTVDSLLKAVEQGEVDVAVGAITVTPERESKIDFMFPYHQTGLTYMVQADESVLSLFLNVFPTIMFGVTIIFGVMLISGLIYSLLEFRQEGAWICIKRVFTGVYWASATYTTVGYGDEAPKTKSGRAFAVVLMWFALVATGSLTGLIVTSANVQTASIGEFNILKSEIGVVDGSAGLHYVSKLVQSHNIHVFENLESAVQAVSSGKVDAVVHDEALLNHMTNTHTGLYVSPETFNTDFYAFAVREGWDRLEQLNIQLLKNNEI